MPENEKEQRILQDIDNARRHLELFRQRKDQTMIEQTEKLLREYQQELEAHRRQRGNPSVEVRGFICRSTLGEMTTCSLNEIDKEIEKLKKYIAEGRKGTALEPRDYPHELDVALRRKDWVMEVYEYLRDKCPE